MMSVLNVRFSVGAALMSRKMRPTRKVRTMVATEPTSMPAPNFSKMPADVGAGDDGEVEYVPGVVEVHVAEGEQLGDALHGEDEGEDVVHDLNERCRAKGRENSFRRLL